VNTGISFGGFHGLQPAVCYCQRKLATIYGRIGDVSSEMFVPIEKKPLNGPMVFYLADVEVFFVEPVVVILTLVVGHRSQNQDAWARREWLLET
jgi:hypothetical protein